LRQRFVAIVGAIALALGLASCGGSSSKPAGPPIAGKQLTIYSSLPLSGLEKEQSRAIVDGAKLALSDAGAKVGTYSIRYVSLDDSTRAAGKATPAATARNARRASADKTTAAYLGEFNSGATKVSLPILNRAGIAMVSPSNTYVGLTNNKIGTAAGEPDKYYPSGERTFARIVPADDVQGAALVTAAVEADCNSVDIWHTNSVYSRGLALDVQDAASRIVASSHRGPAATRFGAPGHPLSVKSVAAINPSARSFKSLAVRVTAPCFIFTGEPERGGIRVLTDVGEAHPQIKLFAGDAMVSDVVAQRLPASVADRFQGTIFSVDPDHATGAAKDFFDAYRARYKTAKPDPYAIDGYEAMSLVLDSMRRAADANGGKVSRAGIVNAVLGTKNRKSVLGTYSIDSNGDTTLSDYSLYRVIGGRLDYLRTIVAPRFG
jgi:branched-chain amino acid transport system substrate-binding protein